MARRRRRRRRKHKDFDFDDIFDVEDLMKRGDFDWDDWGKLRRRVIVDSSKKPDTGFPIGLGIAALFVATFFGLGPLISLVAVLVLFAGLAAFVGRLFSGFRRLATRTFRRLFESKKKRQQRLLLDLERRLKNDGEPRTEHLLRRLSKLYLTLEKDIQDGNLTIAAKDVLGSVDRVNKVCIAHLEESHKLWLEAQADPYVRKIKLEQREALIKEVSQSVDHLESVVAQLHEQAMNKDRIELQRLRRELDESLELAKRVEQRTDDLVESPEVYMQE